MLSSRQESIKRELHAQHAIKQNGILENIHVLSAGDRLFGTRSQSDSYIPENIRVLLVMKCGVQRLTMLTINNPPDPIMIMQVIAAICCGSMITSFIIGLIIARKIRWNDRREE
jgi:hypothetical protein